MYGSVLVHRRGLGGPVVRHELRPRRLHLRRRVDRFVLVARPNLVVVVVVVVVVRGLLLAFVEPRVFGARQRDPRALSLELAPKLLLGGELVPEPRRSREQRERFVVDELGGLEPRDDGRALLALALVLLHLGQLAALGFGHLLVPRHHEVPPGATVGATHAEVAAAAALRLLPRLLQHQHVPAAELSPELIRQ